MKIIHIIFTFFTGGTESMLIDILNEQCKTNKTQLIIIDDLYDNQLLANIDPKVKISFLNRKSGSRSIIPFIKLNCWIVKEKPDVVHVHNQPTPSVLFPWIRPFYTVHSLGISPKYFKRCKCVFAISDSVREDIMSRGSFNVKTVPNGINTEKIITRKNFEKKSPFKIVQVGRLDTDIKGQDILVKAIHYLKQKGIEDIHVYFIGEGSSETELRNLVTKFDIADKVHFMGLKDRKFIYTHLFEYDLMCHPSRSEGFGLTIAEGMAAKIPVLVPDGDGPFDIIERGKYGFFFKKGDQDDFNKQLEYIYINYDKFTIPIIEKAYKHVENEFSIKKLVKSYEQIYETYY